MIVHIAQWVPITLGTLHIDMVIEKATSEELQNLGKEWKTGVLGVKIEARQAKLEGKIPPIINQVDHEIKLSQNVTIHPRKAVKIHQNGTVTSSFQTVKCYC